MCLYIIIHECVLDEKRKENNKIVHFFQIFMLNTRLAQAESMTHDVIRDLIGVKLDMTVRCKHFYFQDKL